MALLDADSANIDEMIAATHGEPLLLDVWASWCAPCRALAPIVKRLAADSTGRLTVAKLDADANAEVSQRLAIRGLPTLLLFKDGAEKARRAGVATRDQVIAWLKENGLNLDLASEELVNAEAVPLGGAFYGDPELRQFLMDRLAATAGQGALRVSRFPYWTDGVGTVSAAMVRSADPAVFERVSGMPLGLAMSLEFADLVDQGDVARLISLLPAGADLRGVPAKLVMSWLADDAWNWPELLSPAADALRLQWLQACDLLSQGKTVPSEAWSDLKARARVLADPDRLVPVDEHFAEIVGRLSPLPASADPAWGTLLSMGTYLVFVAAQRKDGWTSQDFAFEVVRHRWLKQHAPNPQALSEEELAAVRRQFEEEHAEAAASHSRKFNTFIEKADEMLAPWRRSLADKLWAALTQATAKQAG